MSIPVKGFVNANIYASFKPIKKANSMVIVGNKILYIGKQEVAEILAKKLNGEIIDLKGKTVIPAFIDSHIHLDSLAIFLNSLDLKDVKSIDELKNKLKEYYEKNKELSFIYGRGWDQEKLGRWPNKNDLDEIVKEKPVFLERICGHAGVVNSNLLEILEKNEFVKENGIVLENALQKIRKMMRYNEDEMIKFFQNLFNYLLSFGITTCGFVSCDIFSYNILRKMNEKGILPIRVRVYLNYDSLKYIKEKKIEGNEFLKVLGIKIFADGSLGARTAALSKPYNDDKENKGILFYKKEELVKIIKEVSELNLQLAIHAIGDEAIDVVLNSLKEFKNIERLRHRIEHASVIREEQIEMISKLKICVCVQPHFIKSDWWVLKRLGEERAKWIYPLKSMINKNLKLGFSTDAPVEPVNPFETIYVAVKRDNVDLLKYTKEERISLEEALHFYTYGSSYLLFEEENLGSLSSGKIADFIVLDKDPFKVSLEELKNIKVLMTFVGGELKYKANNK